MNNKSKDILLSFVIPFYNSETTLKNCINSILLQKKNSFVEIILINDGSTDKSLKIARKIKNKNNNISLYNNKKNLGVSISRNAGIKYANGQYIIFLDSDDQIISKSLDKIIREILKNKKISFIFFNKFISKIKNNFFLTHSNINKKYKKNSIIDLVIDFTKQVNIYGNIYNYILNRKFLLSKKIFFTSNINFAEDQEFVVKILCFGKKYKFIDDSFYLYNSGQGRLSSSMSSITTKSCLIVITNLAILKNKTKDPHKIKYIDTVITKILKQFVLRLLFLKKNNLLSISEYMKKNQNLLNKVEYYCYKQKKNLKKKITNYYEKLIDLRKKISEDMMRNLKLKKNCKIFTFCYNYQSLALANVLRTKKFNFQGHIDNNYLLLNKNKTSEKIISPKFLGNKNSNYKQGVVVIITNQSKKNIKSITEQLIRIGVPKKQILFQIF